MQMRDFLECVMFGLFMVDEQKIVLLTQSPNMEIWQGQKDIAIHFLIFSSGIPDRFLPWKEP